MSNLADLKLTAILMFPILNFCLILSEIPNRNPFERFCHTFIANNSNQIQFIWNHFDVMNYSSLEQSTKTQWNHQRTVILGYLNLQLLFIIQMNRSNIRHNKSAILHEPSNEKFHILSSSKSPVKIIKGIKLFNFSNIDSYRMINKPYLNSQKSEMIKTKLDLQKSAWLIANQRMKKGREFVKFNYNPFHENMSMEKNIKDFDEVTQFQKKNLIYQINDMKTKNIDRKKYFDALNNKKEQASKLSNFIQKQTNKGMHSKSVIVLPKQREISGLQSKKVKKQKDFEPSLQYIVKMEQESAFKDRYKSINIFRVLFSKEQLFNQKSQLDHFKFCFNSIIQKNLSSKVQFYRDISRQSRGIVNKKPDRMLDNTQEFSKNDIKFQDLMNVSAGRYTPEYIYQQLNNNGLLYSGDFETISEEQDLDLINRTKSTMTGNQHQELRQIEQLKQLQLNKDQKKYEKFCEYRKEQVCSNLRKQQALANATIYDKKIHKHLQQVVNQNLNEFVQSDFKYPKATAQRNRHVQETKQSKNRKEIVKMKKLLQTFFLKKNNDQLINRLITNRR